MRKTMGTVVLVSVVVSAFTSGVVRSFEGEEERLAEQRARIDGLLDSLNDLTDRVGEHVCKTRRTSPALGEDRDDAPAVAGATPSPGSQEKDPGFVTEQDVENLLRRWIDEKKLAEPYRKGAPKGDPQTLEEVAKGMDLSLGETDRVRAVLTEVEGEALALIYGDRPVEDVRDEIHAAEDDPELMTEHYKSTVANWIANVGKLQALAKRRVHGVVDVLGKERGERFIRQRVRSVNGSEFDDTVVKLFGGK